MDTQAQAGMRTGNPQGTAMQPQVGAERPDGRQATDGHQATTYRALEIREVRPRGDETKLSIKSSEFWIFLAAVGGVLIASEVVGINAHHNDYFRADRAWFLIALLTIGYLVSRGLSKAGSSTRSHDRENQRQ
jgi:hypothetical protein